MPCALLCLPSKRGLWKPSKTTFFSETYAFSHCHLCYTCYSHELMFSRKLYLKCLDRRKRSAWNEEGVARTEFLYAETLHGLNKPEEAEKHLKSARKVRDRYLKQYPQWLKEDEDGDELVVFDQMVSIWAGRYTGKMKQPSPVVASAENQTGRLPLR